MVEFTHEASSGPSGDSCDSWPDVGRFAGPPGAAYRIKGNGRGRVPGLHRWRERGLAALFDRPLAPANSKPARPAKLHPRRGHDLLKFAAAQ